MHFLKQKPQFLLEQAKGNISNNFKFTIKDLYKKDQHKIDPQIKMGDLDCLDCGVYLTGQRCLYCGGQSQDGLKETFVKNWTFQRILDSQKDKDELSVQCMIIMVDLSGSMNLTYQSTYKKLNKEYVIRIIGNKNYQILRNTIGQNQVVKNFKTIQMLMQAGQSIRDIGFTIREQLLRQKKNNKKGMEQKQQDLEYISRKQIIQVGITQYVNAIKNKRPNTLITVVYFNTNIQYPVSNFEYCKVIGNIQQKSMEQLLEAGKQAASQISLQSIEQIGDKLISSMTKAQADGQTAMTPALVFCLGMATKWKHDLNQIVIVTDGLSNVGIGQTEQQKYLPQSKKLYEQLSLKYGIKTNCVVNIISFDDCPIGYDVIDQIVKRTGGVPYSIGFKQDSKDKIVNNDTINFLNFQMMTGFCQSTKQFCFDNKMAVKISDPNISLVVPEDLRQYLKIKQKNWVSFDMGVKSVNQPFDFAFIVDKEVNWEKDKALKLTVMHQYRRSKKISWVVRQQLLKIIPGNKQDAVKSQANVLKQEIVDKLRQKVDVGHYEDYENISKKLQKAEVVETIDKKIIQKFNLKKAFMEQYDKNADSITRDKRAIQSRRKQTYNRRKYSEQDIFA